MLKEGDVVAGVDVGGTTVKIGFFSPEGRMLHAFEIVTRTEDAGAYILPDIAEAIKRELPVCGKTYEDLKGIGLDVPGPVDSAGTIYRAVNIGWGVFSIKEEMEKLTNVPVAAGNDATVAALGEVWKGCAKDCDDFLLLTLGTGIGGGIVTGGKILTGATGAGGEIGHFCLEEIDEACTCGCRGCFEQFCSATGFVRITRKLLSETNEVSILREAPIDSKEIFAAAAKGDALANEAIHLYGHYLGKGIAVLCSILNPEVVALGGGVSKAGEQLIDLLRPSFEAHVFHACRDVSFRIATLGNDAGMYGSAKLILDLISN
ncbi:MAG: ROK family glucokinase [Lachnospiraceae bacterium]|nr:ROK family glucokinase [Lachnospiraceae bacterium]